MLLVPVELLLLLAMDNEGMDPLVLLSVLLGKLQGLGLHQHHVHLHLDPNIEQNPLQALHMSDLWVRCLWIRPWIRY